MRAMILIYDDFFAKIEKYKMDNLLSSQDFNNLADISSTTLHFAKKRGSIGIKCYKKILKVINPVGEDTDSKKT